MTEKETSDPATLDNSKSEVKSLGSSFEVVQESSQAAKPSAPSKAAGGQIRSVESWVSFGLLLGLAGLLGPWATVGHWSLVHGGLVAAIVWQLMRSGLATVQPTHDKISPVLPGILLAYGALHFIFVQTGNTVLDEMFGWDVAGAGLAWGALCAMLGGLIAVAGPTLGKKKDASLPKLEPHPVDKQFSQTLLAYLLMTVGLLMPWGSHGETGASFGLGLATLIFVLMGTWAAWVGMWKLWQMPIVTGKLGLVLFLAPIEGFLVGGAGLIAKLGSVDGAIQWPHDAWPGSGSLLSLGGGPTLTFVGSCFALYLLFHGAKAGMELNKQRKEAEIAQRKAARAAKKAK